jgi:hypothetical protein
MSSPRSQDTPNEDLPDLRSIIGDTKARSRDLRRRLDAQMNKRILEAPASNSLGFGQVVPAREFESRANLPGYKTFMQRLFVTRGTLGIIEPSWIDASEVTDDFMEGFARIKKRYQLVPSCRRAVFDEDAENLPIELRIQMYVEGDVWYIGKRADHGKPMVGKTRTPAQRVGAILRSQRHDFLRLTGLRDRCDVETTALTFHAHLFNNGALLTQAGGIPGCPGSVTDLQQKKCQKSLEDQTDYMVGLHRRRVQNYEKPTESSGDQKYTSKEIRLAASELLRNCDGREAPQYAVYHYNDIYGKDADVVPDAGVVTGVVTSNIKEETQEAIDHSTLMNEIDDVIADRTPTLAPRMSTALASKTSTTSPLLPGENCIKVKDFLKGHVQTCLEIECDDLSCVFGSVFLQRLRPVDNLKPDMPVFTQITMYDAGARSNMTSGTCDLQLGGNRKFWHLERLGQWPKIQAYMSGYGWFEGIRGTASMTLAVENYIKGDLKPKRGLERKKKPFSSVHIGSPSGGTLVIHCNFDGHTYQGQTIPTLIQELLADKEIMVVQFGIELVMEKLKGGGVLITSWVEAKNLAMLAYPQPELNVADMKNGISFVALMLDAPTRIYSVKTRDRLSRKERFHTAGHPGPLATKVPLGIPNHRYTGSENPLYTEQERQDRRDFFDCETNVLDMAIDYDIDDFSRDAIDYSTRMDVYVSHAHCIPNALIWRMCHRAAMIHGVSVHADAVRFAQQLLLSLKHVPNFKDAKSPSDKLYRPLGNKNWMTSEESRPDTPFQACPFQAHAGFGYDTHAQAIGQTIGTRERRFAMDPMGLSPGFRQGLESLNRGKIDKIDLEFKIIAMFQRQKCRPHRCLRCGSGNHAKHACLVAEVQCISKVHVR